MRRFGWHAALFPTGFSGMSRVRVGQWRDDASGAMQVVSGPIGRRRVHFEAPPAGTLGELVVLGVLRKSAGGGRSTSYELAD